MARIALIGGHGKVALLATPLLVRDGHEVTAVIRNPDHQADVETAGATALVADIELLDVESCAAILEGHDVVVWSAGAGGGSPERTRAVDLEAALRTMAAAEQVGVSHYVMVSYFGSRPDHGVSPDHPFFAYAEAKAAADAALRASSLAWTILMPSTLTFDDPSGKIDTEATEKSTVSRGNVAQVIAETVRRGPKDLAGRDIRFNDGETPIERALDEGFEAPELFTPSGA